MTETIQLQKEISETSITPVGQTSPNVSAEEKLNTGFNMMLTIFMGVILIGGIALFAYNHFTAPKAGAATTSINNIVYVDMGGIISAATQKFLESTGKDGQKDPSSSGKEFSSKLNIALERYKSAGVIVINKKDVIASPEGHDITADLAKELGLSVGK